MKFKRRFKVRRKHDIKKVLLVTLSVIAVLSAIAAVLAQRRFAESTRWDTRVYRGTHHIELAPNTPPVVNINTAGMAVELAVWDGDSIKIETVAELPLIIAEEIDERFHEITISQDDGFAISFFTLEMFRYHLRVYLPRWAEYERIAIATSGGDVRINGHHLRVLDSVSVETNNATVSVTRGTSVYYIRTRTGDVRMDFDFVVAPVMISSQSGNVTLKVPDTMTVAAEELLFVRTVDGKFVLEIEVGNVPLA
jgi:hypothetical protein